MSLRSKLSRRLRRVVKDDNETWGLDTMFASGALKGQPPLSRDEVIALADVIAAHKYVEKIYLGWHELDDDKVAILARGFAANTSLETISLYHNNIGDEGATALARALKVKNSHVRLLNLCYNKIRDAGARALASAVEVSESLEYLDLDVNKIGNKGAESLASVLKDNDTLERLLLAHNRIGNKGAAALVRALKYNGTVRSIQLDENNISDDMEAEVQEAVEAPPLPRIRARRRRGSEESFDDARGRREAPEEKLPPRDDSAPCCSCRRLETELEDLSNAAEQATSASDAKIAALEESLEAVLKVNKELSACVEKLAAKTEKLAAKAEAVLRCHENGGTPSLDRVWSGKHTCVSELPEYVAVAAKNEGSSMGFIAEKVHSKAGATGPRKRWMAKLALPDESHDVRGSLSSGSARLHRTVLGSVREKIAADTYGILGRGSYYVPKHRLAVLKMKNEFNADDALLNDLLLKLGSQAARGVHLMSKFIEGYRDLADLKGCLVEVEDIDPYTMKFMECLSSQCVPSFVLVEGIRVPLYGLMEVLAVSRLLGDTDVLGGGGKNAGWVVERDADGRPTGVRVVKIDAGESFAFAERRNRFFMTLNAAARPRDRMNSPRDLQFGNNQLYQIEWDALLEPQRQSFVSALRRGASYLLQPGVLRSLIVRRGEFDRAIKLTGGKRGKKLLTPGFVDDLVEGWEHYIGLQLRDDVYGGLVGPVVGGAESVGFNPGLHGAMDGSGLVGDGAAAAGLVGGGGGGEGGGGRCGPRRGGLRRGGERK